jgi:hypothetical protein
MSQSKPVPSRRFFVLFVEDAHWGAQKTRIKKDALPRLSFCSSLLFRLKLRREGPGWALPHCYRPIGRSRTRRSWGRRYAEVRTVPGRSTRRNLARWRHFLSSLISRAGPRRISPDNRMVLLFHQTVNLDLLRARQFHVPIR